MMDTFEAIKWRHSCRSYEARAIGQEQLDQLLCVAHAAPVACGRYDHLALTVIQDRSFMERWDIQAALYMGAATSHPLYNAPLIILISVLLNEKIPAATPYLNAGCIAENITLAATALGLGSVLLAAPVRALLQTPDLLDQLPIKPDFQPAIAVAVGYERSRKTPIRTEYL